MYRLGSGRSRGVYRLRQMITFLTLERVGLKRGTSNFVCSLTMASTNKRMINQMGLIRIT